MSGRLLICLLGATFLAPGPLASQAPALARIDSLLDRSRFTEARTALESWDARTDAAADADDAPHALMLRARLATRADSALRHYLEVALGHPSSRFAPEALLRLGQGYAALGQHERAASYLERIPRDYPGFTARHTATIWLARTLKASGRSPAACAALARALAAADADSASRRLLLLEQRPCQPGPSAPEAVGGAPAAAAPAAQAEAGRYTVQAGAFRDRTAALTLASRLRDSGIPARVTTITGGSLNLVRAGRFPTAAEAGPLLRRVRNLVPAAMLADDAHREGSASR